MQGAPTPAQRPNEWKPASSRLHGRVLWPMESWRLLFMFWSKS